MLCEVEEGSFYLEDLNAHVPLDLSGAVSIQIAFVLYVPYLNVPICSFRVMMEIIQVTTPGMFTENCIVLTEGEMVGGQFRVKIMGFPPPQQRHESLDAIGTFDLFRTGITPQVRFYQSLSGSTDKSILRSWRLLRSFDHGGHRIGQNFRSSNNRPMMICSLLFPMFT